MYFVLITISPEGYCASVRFQDSKENISPTGYLDFYKLFDNFHACIKTTSILKIDDDDDVNFNTLQLNTKENIFHEINLKNNKNIFVYSEQGTFFMAECKNIKAINIPKEIKFCTRFLFVRYYEDDIHEPLVGYLQKNMIIRKDVEPLDITSDFCLKRNDYYNIGDIMLNIKSDTKTNYLESISFITLTNQTSSLKELSQFENFFQQIRENYSYNVITFVVTVFVIFLFIKFITYDVLKFLISKISSKKNST
jgi:hypothetical protein